MATSTEVEDSYASRELDAVRRMISSSAFFTLESDAKKGYYREEVLREINHDGRMESGANGEERHNKS